MQNPYKLNLTNPIRIRCTFYFPFRAHLIIINILIMDTKVNMRESG